MVVLRNLSNPTQHAKGTEKLPQKEVESLSIQFNSIQYILVHFTSLQFNWIAVFNKSNPLPLLQQPRVAPAGAPGVQGPRAPRLSEAAFWHGAQRLQHRQRHGPRGPGRHRPPGDRDDRVAEPIHRAGLPNGEAGRFIQNHIFLPCMLKLSDSGHIWPFFLWLRKNVILSCHVALQGTYTASAKTTACVNFATCAARRWRAPTVNCITGAGTYARALCA